MKYAIYDWAGNRIMPGMEFETFEDGWDYILGDLTDRLNLDEDDYQEYQVLEMNERETRYLDPKDIRNGMVMT